MSSCPKLTSSGKFIATRHGLTMLADHAQGHAPRLLRAQNRATADLELLGSRERWLVYRDPRAQTGSTM